VVPRDRYLNYSDQTMKTRFSARFPGEFDQQNPGLAEIFSGEVFIQGLTNYLIASRIEREKPVESQFIQAYKSDDPSINGRTDPYEVLSHAPTDFMLLDPPDHAIVELKASAGVQSFTWEKPNPPDPYWNIQVSRFDPKVVSDVVTYEWVLIDSVSLTNATRIEANNNGKEAELVLSHGQLWGIMQAMSGQSTVRTMQFVWYVNATDGLYTTRSNPQPGHYLTIIASDITSVKDGPRPTAVTLGQNYPNPFNPSTNISFTTTRRGNVSMKLYDLLGSEVATIVDKTLDAGTHAITYNASGLRSGVYIYRLEAEGKVFSRRMVVMK
jgi:hypothetical protein